MIFSYWAPSAASNLFPGYSSSDIDFYLGATSLVAGGELFGSEKDRAGI